MLFVVASVGVLFSSFTRRAVVLASVAVRCNVLMTTSVVARTGILRVIVAGAWALITMGVIVGLGCTPSTHFFARHGAIVVASAIVRVHRMSGVAVRGLRTRDRAGCRTIVRASACSSRNDSRSVKFPRARGGGDGGPSVILGRPKSAITAGRVLMVALQVGRFEMMLAGPIFLLARWTGIDSAAATVVADAVDGDVIDDGLVVNVNVGDVDVVHGAVVVEMAVPPVSAFIAVAEVSEAIIDSAIKADVWAPVSRMPDIHTATPTPVAGSPEHTHGGRRDPGARHPVVAIGTVGPIAGRPDIAVAGARGLRVHGQHRWGDVHGDQHSREGGSGNDQDKKSKPNETQSTHCGSSCPFVPGVFAFACGQADARGCGHKVSTLIGRSLRYVQTLGAGECC